MTEPSTAQWLDTDGVMARLGVSRRTVERLRRSHPQAHRGAAPLLTTYRSSPGAAPRFRVEDVDALMTPDSTPTENLETPTP